MNPFLRIAPEDNVAVALRDLSAGETVTVGALSRTIREDIPRGHKFALEPIAAGAPVRKYGNPIGAAKEAIPAGAHIHTHNLRTLLDQELEYRYDPVQPERLSEPEQTFQGFLRADGRAGIRNELWILPTVGCVNSIAAALARCAESFRKGSVDTIASFPHPYGCSQMGDDQENTRRILAALASHPNAGGVLILGLGCENSGIEVLKEYLGDYDAERVRFLRCQDVEDEMEEGERILRELMEVASVQERVPVGVSKLVVGLKCGGSDGFSGITANPLVGRFSDRLIAQGGTAILTEVPEMFGAETLLMNRCATRELFDKTVSLINGFKRYFLEHGQTVYENPSPGNKQGGISTLEDKSLGCTQKSGRSPVEGVLAYGEQVRGTGLQLLEAPGNDLIAATALAASGAQVVLFTTGRGTPFACPVPTVKIASNSVLAAHKRGWIDFNAGALLEGTDMDTLTEKLLDEVLEIASGKPVKSEETGARDMAIWKSGVTL